ncbi:MAG: hypothetical protein AVDCRST_MAG38-2964, partial [uncultured Solirubrobacteraceae bacterium]
GRSQVGSRYGRGHRRARARDERARPRGTGGLLSRGLRERDASSSAPRIQRQCTGAIELGADPRIRCGSARRRPPPSDRRGHHVDRMGHVRYPPRRCDVRHARGRDLPRSRRQDRIGPLLSGAGRGKQRGGQRGRAPAHRRRRPSLRRRRVM